MCGAFVWARRALNRPFRRFPAPAAHEAVGLRADLGGHHAAARGRGGRYDADAVTLATRGSMLPKVCIPNTNKNGGGNGAIAFSGDAGPRAASKPCLRLLELARPALCRVYRRLPRSIARYIHIDVLRATTVPQPSGGYSLFLGYPRRKYAYF